MIIGDLDREDRRAAKKWVLLAQTKAQVMTGLKLILISYG